MIEHDSIPSLNIYQQAKCIDDAVEHADAGSSQTTLGIGSSRGDRG